MKLLIKNILVLILYGCIGAAWHCYGVKCAALVAFALLMMGILEGIE